MLATSGRCSQLLVQGVASYIGIGIITLFPLCHSPKCYGFLITFSLIMLDSPSFLLLLSTWSSARWVEGIMLRHFYKRHFSYKVFLLGSVPLPCTLVFSHIFLCVCVCSFNQVTQPFTKVYQAKVFCCWSSLRCIHAYILLDSM